MTRSFVSGVCTLNLAETNGQRRKEWMNESNLKAGALLAHKHDDGAVLKILKSDLISI